MSLIITDFGPKGGLMSGEHRTMWPDGSWTDTVTKVVQRGRFVIGCCGLSGCTVAVQQEVPTDGLDFHQLVPIIRDLCRRVYPSQAKYRFAAQLLGYSEADGCVRAAAFESEDNFEPKLIHQGTIIAGGLPEDEETIMTVLHHRHIKSHLEVYRQVNLQNPHSRPCSCDLRSHPSSDSASVPG